MSAGRGGGGLNYNPGVFDNYFLDSVMWNGHDLERFTMIAVFLPIESRLHPDLVDCEPFFAETVPKQSRY